MSEPNYREEMRLPPGKTCADCYAMRFCVGIGCTKPEATKCDYYPRRFAEPIRRPPTDTQQGGTPEKGRP